MAHKELKFDVEARNALQAGVDAVANAVKVTLGPKGRYVVLDKKFGAPTITNDGVTIAREIEVEDVFQNQGAQLVREVATATNDVAGDGTTTATVLAQAIVRQGLKNVAAGANPLALKRGIEKAVDAVVANIASPISSPTVASCAEMVATPAMAERSATGVAALSSASCTASTAARMPRPRAIGLAPAVTLRRPSWTSAWASTVAVVVPSPATSLVLVATFLASWAPRFS